MPGWAAQILFSSQLIHPSLGSIEAHGVIGSVIGTNMPLRAVTNWLLLCYEKVTSHTGQ